MNQLTVLIALAIALCASVGINLKQWQSCAVEAAKTEGKHNTAAAEATTVATQTARDDEAAAQARADKVAEAYEKGKKDAEEAGRAVVADLRADRIRLRDEWNACAAAQRVPAPGDAAGERDAATRFREESAGRIIQAVTQCEQRLIACQDFVRSERATDKPERTP